MAVFFFLLVFAGIQLLSYYGHKTKKHRAYTLACKPPQVEETDIVFKGSKADIEADRMHSILLKRFPYYHSLQQDQQRIFLNRLQAFLHSKIFIIKDDEGFKEMPVLISAAAVQLSFGLKDFLLPFYKYIRIYPEEYFAEHAFFTVLAGNVKENIITVAWSHLLTGYENGSDGSNVGLHEMSHALYIQKMIIEEGYSKDFTRKYHYLLTHCSQAYNSESSNEKNLYSNYADNNLQEFWAETVELFFEKPGELNRYYPDVFRAMTLLLNQNPLSPYDPGVSKKASGKERLRRIKNWILKNDDRQG